MTNEQLQTVFDKFDQVCLKFGETAETVWPFFIKQQYIKGFCGIVIFIFFCITLFFVSKFSVKGLKEDEDDIVAWLGVGICLISSIIIIALLLYSADILSQLINPEFTALEDLLKMVN